MTIRHLLLPGLALLIASPAMATQDSVTGFKLPPSSDQTPEVQGPVVDDVPAPTVPRPTPTPKPKPNVTPQAEPTPKAVVSPKPVTTPKATPTPTPATRTPSRPKIEPTPVPAPQPSATAEPQPDTVSQVSEPVATPTPAPVETPVTPALSEPQLETGAGSQADEGSPLWPYLLALVVLAISVLAGVFWRKRLKTHQAQTVIERPRVPAAPQPSAPPEDAPAIPASVAERDEDGADPDASIMQDGPLRLALEARELSLTLLNATLSYRLMITNTGDTPLHNLILTGDMIGAHASLTREEQMASEAHDFAVLERIEKIAAGGSYVFNEEFRLPFGQIRPIRQGNSALFVPLVRFRMTADGLSQAALQTAMVGLRSGRGGGGLQPFRLDQGPRVFTELSQRAFT